jgi:hypothetical protein
MHGLFNLPAKFLHSGKGLRQLGEGMFAGILFGSYPAVFI